MRLFKIKAIALVICDQTVWIPDATLLKRMEIVSTNAAMTNSHHCPVVKNSRTSSAVIASTERYFADAFIESE